MYCWLMIFKRAIVGYIDLMFLKQKNIWIVNSLDVCMSNVIFCVGFVLDFRRLKNTMVIFFKSIGTCDPFIGIYI